MFKTSKYSFGKLDALKLEQLNGASCEILVGYGAALNSLKLPNKHGRLIEVIDGYATPEALSGDGSKYKGVFLFPFPNRVKDGKYSYDGKEYQLPINEAARNNALHGFLFDKPFKISKMQTFREKVQATLDFEYLGEHDFYPFPFKISIALDLSFLDGFSCNTTVTNTGTEKMPFGFGWHPYFATGTKINDLVVSFPAAKSLLVDEQMIPTGEKEDFHSCVQATALDKLSFDTGFELKNKNGLQSFTIQDRDKFLDFIVWQEAGPDKFNFYQIYTPPSRNAIAIEPMTCPADAFNNQTSVIELEPGQSVSAAYGVKTL